MNKIKAAEKNLADACFFLAKMAKWRPEPFDEKEVDKVAKEFFRIAMSSIPEMDGDRLAGIKCICGAVEILRVTLCYPEFENPEKWFSSSIGTLMGIVNPLYILNSKHGIEFLSDLERGINLLRSQKVEEVDE
jgi:hypothetical protein